MGAINAVDSAVIVALLLWHATGLLIYMVIVIPALRIGDDEQPKADETHDIELTLGFQYAPSTYQTQVTRVIDGREIDKALAKGGRR